MDLSKSAQLANVGSFVLTFIIFAKDLIPQMTGGGNVDIKILLVFLLLTIGLNIANQIKIYRKTKDDPTGSKGWEKTPKIPIIGKSFSNERVEIDGRSFSSCQFRNVTLVFKGQLPFDFVNCQFLQTVNADITHCGPVAGAAVYLERAISEMLQKAGHKDGITLHHEPES
jgi:hypothetical protein